MKLTRESENRYRGQDGLLYNRQGDIIHESHNEAEASRQALESLREGEQSSEQTEG